MIRYLFLTTPGGYFPRLVHEETNPPGSYEWWKAFNRAPGCSGELRFIQDVANSEFKNYDIVHINLSGASTESILTVKDLIKNSGTKLLVNLDYGVQQTQEIERWRYDMSSFLKAIQCADFIFAQTPYQRDFLQTIWTHIFGRKERIPLIPHPVDTVGIKKYYVKPDERLDWVAVQYHRYDKHLLLPAIIAKGGKLRAVGKFQDLTVEVPTVLFGYDEKQMDLSLFDFVAVRKQWNKYIYMLSHCTEAVSYYSKDSLDRFLTECACILPEELIVTSKGLTPIKDVEVGDFVLTHKGRFRRVLQTYKHNYDGEMIWIKAYGWNQGIFVTPEHPFYACSLKHMHSGPTYRGLQIQIGWISANQLTTNDSLVYPVRAESKDYTKARLRYFKKYPQDPHKRREKWVEKPIPFDDKLCRIIGYYLAEGSPRKYYEKSTNFSGVELSFGKGVQEHYYAMDAVSCGVRLGFGSSINQSQGINKVQISSRYLAEFLVENFGHGAENKHVPNWVLSLPKEKLQIIMDCYLQGDGHQRLSGNYVATTVSLNLAYSIKEIGNKLGYTVAVHLARPERIENLQGRSVHCKPAYVITLNQNRQERILNRNNNIIMKIREIQKVPYNGIVCNLKVQDDASYCTFSHTLHNCLGIPAVSTTCSFFGVALYPRTTFKPQNIEAMIRAMQRLKQDQEFWNYVKNYAWEKVEHFGDKPSVNRLLTAMREWRIKI